MNDNRVKEIISEAFLTLILAKNRFKIYKSTTGDDGVDLLVNPVIVKKRPDGTSKTIDSGKKLDIQLKCTTYKHITHLNDEKFRFQLKVKNYEDLIDRMDEFIPLILIVFILPDDENEWIEIVHDQLLLRKCGYWYFIKDIANVNETGHLKKSYNTGIELEYKNRLTIDFNSLFEQAWALKKG